MTRPYNKKSGYWEARKHKPAPQPIPSNATTPAPTLYKMPDVKYESFSSNEDGEEWKSHARDCGERSGESVRGDRAGYRSKTIYKFGQIDNLPLPYSYDKDGGVDIKEAVDLCHKCYANIGIARNSIDIMSDVANTDYRLVGGTDKSRRFVELWFKRINIEDIKRQFYNECFRSGNIFFYKMTGNWLGRSFASTFSDDVSIASPAKLPLKYVLLNPGEVVRNSSIISTYNFSQKFSEYELQRLKNPTTDAEKEVFKSIREKAQTLDLKGIVLEDKDICFAFYNKQDYEPFALPFLWPALSNINLKLEMKKRDQAVLRLVNYCILLLTNGTEPDKGGVNPAAIAALQRLLQTEAAGRALAADYTTKGEFLIPDLKKIIYPEKYQIVNEDIKEDLMNILFGTDAKYGNLVVKVQVFLQKMRKARYLFEKMMQREVEIACEYMGIVSPPTVKTDSESLEDPAVLQKTGLRLLELGVLTPEEAIPLIKNREYPDLAKWEGRQKAWLKQREEGLNVPLVNGQPLYDNGIGDFAPPAGAVGQPGRPKEKGMASDKRFTMEDIKKVLEIKKKVADSLESYAKEKFSLLELNPAQKSIVSSVVERTYLCSGLEKWESFGKQILDKPEILDELVADAEIIQLALEAGSSVEEAALWHHANKLYNNASQNVKERVEANIA